MGVGHLGWLEGRVIRGLHTEMRIWFLRGNVAIDDDDEETVDETLSLASVPVSVRKRPVRPGFGSAWVGLGFGMSRPGRTVGRSPASEDHLTGPGRTADICRLSSDKM